MIKKTAMLAETQYNNRKIYKVRKQHEKQA